jgi:hypothetical protein
MLKFHQSLLFIIIYCMLMPKLWVPKNQLIEAARGILLRTLRIPSLYMKGINSKQIKHLSPS